MRSKGSSYIISVVLILSLLIIASVYLTTIKIERVDKPVFAVFRIEKITKGYRFDQVVVIRHIAGEPLYVKDMALHVVIYRDGKPIKSCTIQNFPWSYGVGYTLPSNAINGDDIIDENPNHYARYLGELSYKSDGVFSSGETVGFRIKRSGVTLQRGDVIEVDVIYRGREVYCVSKTFS